MTNKRDDEMSGSDVDKDMEPEAVSENGKGVTAESESEEEGVQITKKRARKMIIEDESDADEGTMAKLEDSEEEALGDGPLPGSQGSPASVQETPGRGRKRTGSKRTSVDDILTEVLKDSDSDEGEEKLTRSATGVDTGDVTLEDSEQDSDSGQDSQGPMKFNRDLFDAEDSSDDNLAIDRAAGPGYDSAEDKDFDESSIDPKLLKKLKKIKGAAKKPREQKSRKCKPSKDDLLELHSESQRLLRESHLRLPYHKPAPKSLHDFMARAEKKREAYKVLRGASDIEKAQVIQDKIAETSIVKLPKLHHPGRSSQKGGKRASTVVSQQSLPDSGHASSTSDLHSQGTDSQPSAGRGDLPSFSSSNTGPISEDDLPDLVTNHGDGLCATPSDSQSMKGSKAAQGSHGSQDLLDSQSSMRREESQPASDRDQDTVEEYDSPPPAQDSLSQPIEDVESLSLKDHDSQRSEGVVNSLPDSCEPEGAGDGATDSNHADAGTGGSNHTSGVRHSATDSSHADAGTGGSNHTSGVRHSATDSSHADTGTGGSNHTQPSAVSHSATEELRLPQLCVNVSCKGNELGQPGLEPCPASISDKEDAAQTNGDAVTVRSGLEAVAVNSLQAARRKAVEELVEKGVVPALGRGDGHFIILDEEGKERETEVDEKARKREALMARLLKQYQKPAPRKAADVEISIVEKTGEEGQEKELKLKTVTYHTEGDLDTGFDPHLSGRGLEELKRQLEQGMRKRRAAAFERRQQMYRLENEEGYEEDALVDGLPQEEEEAEMTDKSDTEDEGESDVGEEGEEKDWNNPFFDDEAEEGDDDDDDEDAAPPRAVCAEINDMGEDDEDLFQDTDKLHLRLDVTDDEEENEEEEKEDGEEKEDEEENEDEDSVAFKKPQGRKATQLTISDDENSAEKIPSAQDRSKTCVSEGTGEAKGLDLSFEMMTPMTRLLQDTQPSGNAHRSQPVEDSQDLYGGSESDHNNSIASSAMHTSFSDDAVSQILDADGYIRIATTQPRRSAKSSLLMEGSQEAAAGMEELMGLCSGQFGQDTQGEVPASAGFRGLFDNNSHSQDERGSLASLFDPSSQSQSTGTGDSQAGEDGIDDILRLCSGQFSSSNTEPGKSQPEAKRGVKRRLVVRDDSSDEDGNEAESGPFQILSDEEASKGSEKNELSGSEDEKEDGHNSDASEQQTSFKGFKNKREMLRQFVEDEAELSGSEVESDENLDLDEEDDYLELEAGDNDVTLNQDELRDQVGRVHLKQVLDDDDRELMRYKEMYLPDGDLHSEGAGRQRRFHWKNMGDEESQQDMFADGSDEEKEGEDADEKLWRMERFEREKFLESQQEEVAAEDKGNDNSQFLKFGKFFVTRQVSDPAPIIQERTPALLHPNPVRSQSLVDKASPGKFVKPKIPKRGSFLSRSKENLAKIAEITKSSALNVNSTRNSRNFVFSILSADKGEDGESEKLLTKTAAAVTPAPVVKRVAPAPHKPPAKRKRAELTPKPQSQKSIFRLLDK